jgi:hypothetical protein
MMHWAPTLFLSITLLMFAVPTFAIAVAVWVMLIARLLASVLQPAKLPSALLAIMLWGSFATIFGYGAFQLGAMVIDGFIGRFL